VGVALSNRTIGDGDVRATFEFDHVTNETTCQFVVSYNPNATHLVAAGLGGETWALFSIREFGGPKAPQGWWAHRMAGDRSILKDGSTHQVEARFRGAQVTLFVNDVLVGSTEVSSPTGQARQVGLLCRSESTIIVRDVEIHAAKPKAFMVMQFEADYDAVYNDVVKEVTKDYEITTIRGDEVSGPGLVISDIIREISESQLIIADITPTNANVYFEVGYALALGKPTILLARKGTILPFDVSAYRVLFYEDSIGGKKKLENGLRRHLDAILTSVGSPL
jgi:hypothetical protein